MTALDLCVSRVAEGYAGVTDQTAGRVKKRYLEDIHGAKSTLPPSYQDNTDQPNRFLSDFMK